jgi:hypothetical protein
VLLVIIRHALICLLSKLTGEVQDRNGVYSLDEVVFRYLNNTYTSESDGRLTTSEHNGNLLLMKLESIQLRRAN